MVMGRKGEGTCGGRSRRYPNTPGASAAPPAPEEDTVVR